MQEDYSFNPDTIHLSKGEQKRFLEIAFGDSIAANTQDEDALFRFRLIREYIKCETDTSTNITRVNERAVGLTNLGEDYFAWYKNEKQRIRRESIKFWITTLLSLLAFLLAFSQFLLSTQG